MPTMSVDVVILAQEVQRRRQTLLVGTLGILVLGVGTLAGPFVGSMMVSITMSGSPFFGGPLVETGLSDRALTTIVGLGSVLVSGPLCLAMLAGSWVWHHQVRVEAERAGIDRPALGIAAPARLVAWPFVIGVALTALLVPVPLLIPTPDSSDILGNALAGGALLTPLLGPLIGLLVGWRRGVDTSLSEAWQQGTLSLDDLDSDEIAAFPMIARAPRTLRRVELLRDAGRHDEAEAALHRYLTDVGVGLHRGLLLLAEVREAGGRTEDAELALAMAGLQAWVGWVRVVYS